MIKISLGRHVLVSAVIAGLASSPVFADGAMTPPAAPTPKSKQQIQRARTQQSQKSQDELNQERLDRQQYEQSQPVRRDIPEPDDLFDD